MTDAHDDQRPAQAGHDRRAFLQRAGLGAVAAGAWVAPQVLFTSVASAGCTPITKRLQINAGACASGVGVTTTVNPNLPSCVPAGWASGVNDGVTFTCTTPGVSTRGATINVTLPGCGPTVAWAVKFCPFGSGPNYTCIPGTIVGATVTFPTIVGLEALFLCQYIDYRITVTCCT